VPKVLLTAETIRRSTCPVGVRKINLFDTRVPGFMLEIRSSGGKTFYQRYRDDHGREKQFKIGSASVLTISKARRRARDVLVSSMVGNDPQKERQILRRITSLAEFSQQTYLPFATNTKRSWRTDETILRLHILPQLGHLTIDQISDRNIAKLLSGLQQQGYSTGTTNRVLVLLRFMFNLGRKWDILGFKTNPTAGLKTAPDVCRQRYLTRAEAQRLLSALADDENQVAASAIRLLLLTGGRRNEITYAKWEYVDWERQTLLVPRSKTGRARSIYLNSTAMELLRSIPRHNSYIFPSPVTGRPSPSLYFPWSRIRRRCGLPDVRLHDLRHSFASFLVNDGVSLYVVQGLLGHTQVRATQRYAHLASDTLSDAAERVAAHLADAAEVIRGVVAPPGEAEIVLDEQALGQRPQTGQTL
jgi:integrase